MLWCAAQDLIDFQVALVKGAAYDHEAYRALLCGTGYTGEGLSVGSAAPLWRLQTSASNQLHSSIPSGPTSAAVCCGVQGSAGSAVWYK